MYIQKEKEYIYVYVHSYGKYLMTMSNIVLYKMVL